MIPELDSHHISPSNPEPLTTRFSRWHACGPAPTHARYSAGMKLHADLHLLGTVLRLKPGNEDVQGAAKSWEDMFGVERAGSDVVFTNARMTFVKGVSGEAEGIVEIRIGVEGRGKLRAIWKGAQEEGLKVGVDRDQASVGMLGLKWTFVDVGEAAMSRL